MIRGVSSIGFRASLAAVISVGLSIPASAQLVAPGVSFAGATQNQWAARWYQWALPQPIGPGPEANRAAHSPHPAVETSGSQSFNGNNVFPGVSFLAGVFTAFAGTETANRTMIVPVGNVLFFPIINNYVDNTVPVGQTPTTLTPDQLLTDYPIGLPVNLSLVNTFNNVTNLTLTIDGVNQPILPGHRQTNGGAGFITTYIGPDNIDDLGGFDSTLGTGVYPSNVLTAGDGWWAAVSPLSLGNHTLHFTGTGTYFGADGNLLDFDPTTDGVQSVTFNQDITYQITVVSPEPATATLFTFAMVTGGLISRRSRRNR